MLQPVLQTAPQPTSQPVRPAAASPIKATTSTLTTTTAATSAKGLTSGASVLPSQPAPASRPQQVQQQAGQPVLSQQSAARPGTPPNQAQSKPTSANPATAAKPTKAVIQPVLASQANKPSTKAPAESAQKTGNSSVIQPFSKGAAAKQNNVNVPSVKRLGSTASVEQ